LRAVERQFIGNIIGRVGERAMRVKLSESGRECWSAAKGPAGVTNPLDGEDLVYFDIPILAVGRVPPDG
jgi:hypothetical protein